MQFEIDANGMLKVLARDTKTGHERVVELRSAVDVTDERVERMIADSVEHAFDDWKLLDGRKLHFVFIDFVGGRYRLQARQYDGTTGLRSPLVRRDQTAERGLVARTAANCTPVRENCPITQVIGG